MSGDGARQAAAIPPPSVAKHALVTIGFQVALFASGVVLTPILIRLAGEAVYGQYVLLLSLGGFLAGVSSFGIGFGARRRLPNEDQHGQRSELFFPQLWSNLGVVTSFALVIVVLALAVGDAASIASAHIVFLVVYLFAITLQSQGGEFLRSTHRIGAFNMAMTGQPYLFLTLVLIGSFGFGANGLEFMLGAQVVSVLCAAAFSLIFAARELPLRFALLSRSDLIKDIKLGGALVLAYMADTVLQLGDRYVIALYLPIEHVTYYVVAYVLGSLPLYFVRAVNIVLTPRVARLVDSNQLPEAQRLVGTTVRIYLALSLPFVVGAVLMGQRVAALYATPEAAAGSFFALPVIALSSVFYGVFLLLTVVFFVRENTVVILRSNAIAAVLNVVLNLAVLYFVRDIWIAAATTVLGYAFVLTSVIRKLEHGWLNGVTSTHLLRTCTASAAMGIAVGSTLLIVEPTDGIWPTLLLIMVGVLSYIGAALAVQVVTISELLALRQQIFGAWAA